MNRVKTLRFVLLLLALLSLSLNAQVNYFYSKDGEITFKLRKDLLYVELEKNVKEQEKIIRDIAKSTVIQSTNFMIVEIDTLKINTKHIERYSMVKNFANVLEYSDGILQVPTNKIFVCPKADIDIKKMLDVFDSINIQVISNKPLYENSDIFMVEVKTKLNNILEITNKLSKNPIFEFVEPCFTRLLKPANSYWGNQWGFENTGQYNGTTGIDIKAQNAWGYSRGENVKVAVIDEGVQLDHPDLAANILTNLGFDATSGAPGGGSGGSPQLSYHDAHGTACAGIIVAVNNNAGVVGIASSAKIVPIRIAYSPSPQSSSWITNDNWIATGINHAWRNADVLNNSWSGGSNSVTINRQIDSAFIRGRGGKGSVVVFAAGNNNGAVNYPANSNPNIIVVGAMSPCGERKSPNSCDTEWRWGSNYGAELDVVAPGVLVPTTDIAGGNGYNPNVSIHPSSGGTRLTSDYTNQDYTVWFNGTSAAAPHVAGVAALVLSRNSLLTQKQVANIIESTAQKVRQNNPYVYSNNPTIRPNGTWNNEMGYGLVNAYAAVQAACSTPTDFTNQTVTTNTTVTSCGTINTENTTVTPTGTLKLQSPTSVNIGPGFTVEAGGSLIIEVP